MHAGKSFKNHRLSLNMDKAKAMMFGTTHHPKNETPPIVYNNKTVEMVDSFKYLGLFLDQRLSFHKHIAYLRKKVFVKLKILGPNKAIDQSETGSTTL